MNTSDDPSIDPNDIEMQDAAHIEPASDTDDQSEHSFRAKDEILRPSGDQI